MPDLVVDRPTQPVLFSIYLSSFKGKKNWLVNCGISLVTFLLVPTARASLGRSAEFFITAHSDDVGHRVLFNRFQVFLSWARSWSRVLPFNTQSFSGARGILFAVRELMEWSRAPTCKACVPALCSLSPWPSI